MSVIFEDKARLVMPRYVEYWTACSIGLQRAIRRTREVTKNRVNDSDARREWLDEQTIPTAVDLVAEALIVKDYESEEAVKAAKYILDGTDASSILIRQLASHFLEEVVPYWTKPVNTLTLEEHRGNIARLKKSVRIHPLNPIAWSDMALSYVAIEQKDKAIYAMNVALGLSNNNRFILRSASRCFSHLYEPDRAVAVLRKSGLCDYDPWITSAEIAISEGFKLKSKCISKSKYMIKDDSLTYFSRSELMSGMATLEFNAGSLKRTKRLMREAVIDPTENALAQVEWLSNQINEDISEIIKLKRDVPASYEAQALDLYYKKKFEESLEASKRWGRYIYLSSRPILQSSNVAAVQLDNDEEAIRIIENCSPAQKNNPGVMNNYTFSLARSGDTERAKEIIKNAKSFQLSERQKYVITATEGLIAFRSDNVERGRLLYSISVKGFERISDLRAAAMATYFWAVEEKRIKAQSAESVVEEARKRINRSKVFDFEDLVKKL